jgi:hypothetical protein
MSRSAWCMLEVEDGGQQMVSRIKMEYLRD